MVNKKIQYVYHGSQYNLDIIKPMQAHGGCQKESRYAIYAVATPDEAIPFALPFRWYPDTPEGKRVYEVSGIKSFLKYGSKNPDGVGYIYKLPADTFEMVNQWEWLSYVEVKPMEVIEIKVKDYFHSISFSEESKKIQQKLYGKEQD